MTVTSDDTDLCAQWRDAVALARSAHHQVLELTAQLAVSDLPSVSGYRSTGRLLQDLGHLDPRTATRWLTDAAHLTERYSMTGEPLEPVLPATAAASHDGDIGPEHVQVIRTTMDVLRRIPDLDPELIADAETELAHAATTVAPHAVDKLAERIRGHLDPDGVAPLDPPVETDELRLGRSRRDGSLTLTARIHGAGDSETLREVLDALSAPAGPDDTRPLAQRHAAALLELAEHATTDGGIAADEPLADEPLADEPLADETPADETPADNAESGEPGSRETEAPSATTPPLRPGPARGRPLLVISIDHRALLEGIGHGLLDSDRTIAAAEARRLACDAGVLPAVLGSRGQPLDVGRLSYTVPDGMRRALHLRDRGCTFPGCTRRPRRCHAHHVEHWIDDGVTALDNLTLLCRFHHQLIHHGDWHVQMTEGRPWFTPPDWIDPRREPRPGGPHRPEPRPPGP